MSERFEAPKGTFDYLPPAAAQRAQVEARMLDVARRAGYELAETPIIEETGVFTHGVGLSTDIVTREMYTFADKGGRSLSLRPENTAGVVRALMEHGRLQAGLSKLVYSGPYFRYERPQAGRQRQFHQVGIEAIGSDDPGLDAEVIVAGEDIFRTLGASTTLLYTSLGDATCRPAYGDRLREYLRGLGDALPASARARIDVNPLRVLDAKDPEVQRVTADAPVMRDALCAACKAHDDEVRELLAAAGVSFVEAPRLVRGLDYYVRTTFEWQSNALDAAQNALGGGGRYDGLAELLGGPPVAGVGWSLGLDRIVLALTAEHMAPSGALALDVYVIPVVAAARVEAFKLLRTLREAGAVADMPYRDRSLKGHMKDASSREARAVVLIGEAELATGRAGVRDMTTREQQEHPLAEVPARVLSIVGART